MATKPTEDLEMQEERAAFLSEPPRSGQLSPFAQKLAAETFVWLASIVVFGATANFATDTDDCSRLCVFGIVSGIMSFLFTSTILLGHYLTWSNKIDKSSWFTSAAEMRFMIFLTLWWIISVACLSAVESGPTIASTTLAVSHTTGVGIMFGWLALLGSIFGAYKAYHASKEEQTSLHFMQVRAIQATEEEEFANYS